MADSDYDVDSPVPNDIEDEGLECEPEKKNHSPLFYI